MGKKIKEADFERIVTQFFVFSLKKTQIAAELGLSDTAVGCVVNTFQLVKKGNVDAIIANVRAGTSYPSCIYWAARKLGIDMPHEQIDEAYQYRLDLVRERKMMRAEKNQISIEKTEEPPKEEPVERAPEMRIEQHNESLFLDTLYDAITEQNALLTRLIETVLPSCISDIKDNINVNCDILAERLAKCEQYLDNIRFNTRKRGQ